MRTRSWVTPNRTPQAGAPRCGLSSLFSLLFTSLTGLGIHRHQFLNTRESEAAPRTSCRIRTPRPLRRWAEPVRPEPRVVPEARTRPAGPRRGGPRSPEAGSPGTAGTEWSWRLSGHPRSPPHPVRPESPCLAESRGPHGPALTTGCGPRSPRLPGLFLPPWLLTAPATRPPACDAQRHRPRLHRLHRGWRSFPLAPPRVSGRDEVRKYLRTPQS